MSVFSITAVTSGTAADALIAAQAANAHQQTQPAATAIGQQDTAALSPTARALELYREGEPISTVAVTMDTSVAQIDAYLNITPEIAAVAQRSTAVVGA
jgi:hypothetical protein